MTDETYAKVVEFQKEFKQLVRKFVPVYPRTASKEDDETSELLAAMQDSTSCYNPYVWSEEDAKAPSDSSVG